MSKDEDNELGYLNINSSLYRTRISKKFASRVPFSLPDEGIVTSFIPGTVTEILVSVGDHVKEGERLMVLDAMKMQNNLNSSIDGIVSEVRVKKGEKVAKGAVLCVVARELSE